MTQAAGRVEQGTLSRQYLFSVGSRPISSYLVLLYLGCVAGILAGVVVGGASGLNPSAVALSSIVLLIPALVGARLLYILCHPVGDRGSPRRLPSSSQGGAALYGGLVGSFAASVPVLAAVGLPLWGFWDAASVAMLVGLVFGRVGCLMQGCCAGRPATGPLAMWLPGRGRVWEYRLPTQLLEAGWAAVVLVAGTLFGGLLSLAGARFAFNVAAYCAGRVVFLSLREGSETHARVANVAASALLVMVASVGLLIGWSR